MLGLKMKTTNVILKRQFCFCLILSSFGLTPGHGIDETGVIKVVAVEGYNAILPCSLSSKDNIVQQLFDWKKDGQKEVFLYDAGIHYNNGRAGQDQQFRDRVFHFPEQLKFGNASIVINDTRVTDSGDYTCDFPRLEPERKTFNIRLVVERVFKDRYRTILGAAPEPHTKVRNITEEKALLQCEVRGAFPKPVLQWQDSDGKVLPAEEPQVMSREDRYYVTLLTTVTKTTGNHFFCVVTQEEISHRTEDDIYVPFCEDKPWQLAGMFTGGWFSGVLTVAALWALFKGRKYIKKCCKKGPLQNGYGFSAANAEEPTEHV